MNKRKNKNIKYVLVLVILIVAGCARRTETITNTEVHRDNRNSEYSNYDNDRNVDVVTTKEVTKEEEHHGFFSIIFDIIALPFRAIGAIL